MFLNTDWQIDSHSRSARGFFRFFQETMFLASCKPAAPPPSSRSAQLFGTYPFFDERKLRNKLHARCYSNKSFRKPPGELLRLLVLDDLQGKLSRVCRLPQLTLTIPATGAEAEHLLSCLRRLKTNLRNTCRQGRLVNLAKIAIDRVVLDLKAGCLLLEWKAGEWIGVGETHVFLCTTLLVTEPTRKPFVSLMWLYRLIEYIVVSSWLGSIWVHWSCCALVVPHTATMQGCVATGTGLFCRHPLGHAAFWHFGRLNEKETCLSPVWHGCETLFWFLFDFEGRKHPHWCHRTQLADPPTPPPHLHPTGLLPTSKSHKREERKNLH